MMDDELKEIAIAEKNEFINKQADMINTLKIFKDDVKEYLDYLNSLSGTEYNIMQFEQNRKHEISENLMKSQDEIENLDNNEKQKQPVIGKLIEEKITAKYEENNENLPE